MSEAHDERMTEFDAKFRGPKGDRGDTGDGLPRSVRRAIVWLFLASCGFSLIVGALLLHYVNENNSQRCDGLAAVARQPLLEDAGIGNPSRQALNTIIKADRARAKRLHCS